MSILNLTQHKATKEQLEAGVIDLSEKNREFLIKELTFDEMPSREEIKRRAENIGLIPGQYGFMFAMIGGAPFLMPSLEKVLIRESISPLYAFSKRESVEVNKEGNIIKTSIFVHKGFISI